MKMIVAINLLIVIMMPVVSFASEAKVVLKEYLDLDAKGARMQEWQSEKYLANPLGEPGWDEVTIITGYSIKSETCSGDRCIYQVIYSLYPTREEPQVAAHPKGGNETIAYKMKNRKGKWVIEDFVQPHVLVNSYKKITGNR